MGFCGRAGDGRRDAHYGLEFRRVLFRSVRKTQRGGSTWCRAASLAQTLVFDSDASAFEPHRNYGQGAPLSSLDHRSIGRPPTQDCLEGDGIRIEWPWTSHGRARKILSRSGARRRYVVPCFRGAKREVHCEAGEERDARSEEHTSELQSLMRISY